MEDQLRQPAHTASHNDHARRAPLGWLRERLLPGGDAIMMVVAYAMILAALVSLILIERGRLPPWRFYGAVLALSALLVLNIGLRDIETRLGSDRASRAFLLASAALFCWRTGWAASAHTSRTCCSCWRRRPSSPCACATRLSTQLA
jgi:hypothetical protein